MAAALETALAQDLLRVRPTLLLLLPAGATEPGHVTKGRVQDGQVCGSLLAADGGQAAGLARRRGAAGGLWGTRHKAWAQLHLVGAVPLCAVRSVCGGRAPDGHRGPAQPGPVLGHQRPPLMGCLAPAEGEEGGLSRPTAHWGQGSP